MPEIKLTYFDFPGRAEASRLALTIGGIPFEDERLLFEEFVALKPTLPYASLPVLTVDGQVYAQSVAILRYCGKLASIYPEDTLHAQQTDEVLDTIIDFITGLEVASNPPPSEDDQDNVEKGLLTFLTDAVPRYLGGLDNRLQSFGEGPWAVGGSLSIADLAIYVCLLNVSAGAFEKMSWEPLQPFTRLMASFYAVEAHPKVAAWNADIARRAAEVREAAESAAASSS